MPIDKLPNDLDCERLILGSALQNSGAIDTLRPAIDLNFFLIEKHKRIWSAICAVYDRGSVVDRVVVFSELSDRGQAQSVDGLGYLVSLDDGLPQYPSLDRYVSILREKSKLRTLIAVGESLMKRAASEAESANEITDSMLTALESDGDLFRRPISTRQMIDTYGIDTLLKPRREEGLRLPWAALNTALCGLHGGQMVVVAGDTGKGKTSLALQIAAHATRQDKSPVIWTLEMSSQQMFRRMVNQIAAIDADRSRHGVLTPEENARCREAAYWLHGHPVWFDRHSRTVASFCASIRQASAKSDVGLAVVDYLQLIRGSGRPESRTREVGENSRSLKLAAMDTQLPFLVLSQFRRMQGEAASIHSLKESGDIENDADIILLINCPDLEGKDAVSATVKIGKQREGPAGFDIPLEFRPASQSFHSESDTDPA